MSEGVDARKHPPEFVGVWRATEELQHDGTRVPLPAEGVQEFTFRADGTAEWRFVYPRHFKDLPSQKPKPFPETWEVAAPGTLSVWVPIAPMPEYELPDWTREEQRYEVVAVTPDTLTLSDLPYDGASVLVCRRQGR